MDQHAAWQILATSTMAHAHQPHAAALQVMDTAQPVQQAGHLRATAQIVTPITSVPPAYRLIAISTTAPANL